MIQNDHCITFAELYYKIIMPMEKLRKRIATDSAPEIPYPRVRVEWIDCVSDSGWATDKEFDNNETCKTC